MVFTRKQNMEITKSEKFLKKRNKTFWGIFFYMTSSKKESGSELS